MLTAFYDLMVCPAKYDFLGFLLDAERFRRLTQQESVRFVFVPGPNHGFREDPLPPHSIPRRKMMLDNILVPMCQMTGAQVEVIICPTRQDARKYQTGEIFPMGYLVDDPIKDYGTHVFMRAFARKFYPLHAVNQIQPQPDLITITLRESHYWPARNGNRETWLAAAEMIKAAGLRPLFVPDVDSPPVEGWESDKEASTNLHHRAALYESAAHNFFVSNGPAWMAAAMPKVNSTIFKAATETGGVSCSKDYWELAGFPVGSQIGRHNHRIVWEDDTKEAVLPVVVELIESCKKGLAA